MNEMSLAHASPASYSIEKLSSMVKSGSIVLPKFQREFVWKKNHILEFLESIRDGYPIGSILLWESQNQELVCNRRIGDLEIDTPRQGAQIQYVLDGQQRLSSLCGPLYWSGKQANSLWNIVYDLREQSFKHLQHANDPPLYQMRLSKILGDSYNQYSRTLYQQYEGDDKDQIIDRAWQIHSQFAAYQIPVITLRETPSTVIAEIFERINKTGRRLTTVDLMQAATWRDDFDLMASIREIKKRASSHRFDRIEAINLLRNISSAAGKGFHAASIVELRDEQTIQLKQSIQATSDAYYRAVDFLSLDIGVSGSDMVPYANQLTVITDIFRQLKRPKPFQLEAIRKWFWRTSLSDYFQGWNTARMESDRKRIQRFVEEMADEIEIDAHIGPPNSRIWIENKFSAKNALSKAFIALLCQQQPIDLLSSAKVPISKSLSKHNSKEVHHVFPKKFLSFEMGIKNRNRINCLANRIFLTSDSNKKISSKRPSVYLQELKEIGEDKLIKILKSHFISEPAYEAALSDDYEAFLEERAKTIQDAANRNAGWNSVPMSQYLEKSSKN